MKHFSLIALLALGTAVGATAQTTDFLTFRGTDGNEISLPAVGTKITFDSEGLLAVNGEHSVSYSFDTIDLMFFSSTATSISSAAAPSATVAIVDGQLRVNAPAGTPVALYNAEGRRLSTAGRLPHGLYLVRVGEKNYKLISE